MCKCVYIVLCFHSIKITQLFTSCSIFILLDHSYFNNCHLITCHCKLNSFILNYPSCAFLIFLQLQSYQRKTQAYFLILEKKTFTLVQSIQSLKFSSLLYLPIFHKQERNPLLYSITSWMSQSSLTWLHFIDTLGPFRPHSLKTIALQQ